MEISGNRKLMPLPYSGSLAGFDDNKKRLKRTLFYIHVEVPRKLITKRSGQNPSPVPICMKGLFKQNFISCNL